MWRPANKSGTVIIHPRRGTNPKPPPDFELTGTHTAVIKVPPCVFRDYKSREGCTTCARVMFCALEEKVINRSYCINCGGKDGHEVS